VIPDRIPKESEFDVGLKQKSILVGPSVGVVVAHLLVGRDESQTRAIPLKPICNAPDDAGMRIVCEVVVGIV
jgi:hypothetical protein